MEYVAVIHLLCSLAAHVEGIRCGENSQLGLHLYGGVPADVKELACFGLGVVIGMVAIQAVAVGEALIVDMAASFEFFRLVVIVGLVGGQPNFRRANFDAAPEILHI